MPYLRKTKKSSKFEHAVVLNFVSHRFKFWQDPKGWKMGSLQIKQTKHQPPVPHQTYSNSR